MRLTRLELKNWRNFANVNVQLERRVFILGNNGLGKSNLLDAFRFLHDISKVKGGGLQDAIDRRGGFNRIRSLFARRNPVVKILLEAEEENGGENKTVWHYCLVLKQESRGNHRPYVESEIVKKNGKTLLERPDDDDKDDHENRIQTALEQTRANKKFRSLVEFFQKFRYLHMVPQLVRYAADFQGKVLEDDPFGQGLLNNMAGLPEKNLNSRLRRIGKALGQIKPRLRDFKFERDEKTGKPHLRFRYEDWRKDGSFQNEEALSDGELRLIGLVWTLLEGKPVIMLEEPELSFNEKIIKALPGIFAKVSLSRKKTESQVILTTHSTALLQDEGISGDEIVLLTDGGETTTVTLASDNPSIAAQLRAGFSTADAALPYAQSDVAIDISG